MIIRKIAASDTRGIWFHGTTDKHLQSILSQGLVPNPKQRAWSDHNETSLYTPSRKSLDGVYVTTNLMTAIGSARTAINKNGGRNKLIICLELESKSLVADEDSVNFTASVSFPNQVLTEYNAAWNYMAMMLGEDMSNEVEHTVNSWFRFFWRQINDDRKSPGMENRLREVLREGFAASLGRTASHIDDMTWKSTWYRVLEDYEYKHQRTPTEVKKPSVSEGETAYLAWKDKLTRLIKTHIPGYRSQAAFNDTARSLQPIGFSGSNKIVAVIEILDGKPWGMYEVPKLIRGSFPDKFIEEWTKRVGSFKSYDQLPKPSVTAQSVTGISKDQIEDWMESPEGLIHHLNKNKVNYSKESVPALGEVTVIHGRTNWIIHNDWVYEFNDWIYDIDIYKLREIYPLSFNEQFWARPTMLYHATPSSNKQDILRHGAIMPSNKTRGISNKSIPDAVFTVSNIDSARSGTYGDLVFQIDTGAMKQDGYTPNVELEPPVERANLMGALAHKLGIEDFYPETGMDSHDPETVIVFGEIPLKYTKNFNLAD